MLLKLVTFLSGDGIHFACFICKGLYSNFSVLLTHLQTLHDPAKPFACFKCGKTYGTNERLQAHIQTHVRNTKLRNLNLNPVVRRAVQSSMVSSSMRGGPSLRRNMFKYQPRRSVQREDPRDVAGNSKKFLATFTTAYPIP